MPRSGKRLALVAVIVGAFVAVALLFLSRDRVLEEWYVYRLSSGDEATRIHAAERLAELESVRAVPALVEAIRKDENELGYLDYGGGRIVRAPRRPSRILLTPLAHCLFRIGAKSPQRSEIELLLPPDSGDRSRALQTVKEAWQHPEARVERKSRTEIEEEERGGVRRL